VINKISLDTYLFSVLCLQKRGSQKQGYVVQPLIILTSNMPKTINSFLKTHNYQDYLKGSFVIITSPVIKRCNYMCAPPHTPRKF